MKSCFLPIFLICLGSTLYLQAQNPAIDVPHPKNADPSALVASDGKVYVYTTWNGTTWKAYSSRNLSDWDEHDIFSLEETGWAKARAWAPDCVEKNGTYYFYYPGHYGEGTKGMYTGVAVSNSPTGPFKEALGKPLLEHAHDPCVFKDEDGSCYLYAQFKVVRLGEDMTSLAEEVREVELAGHEVPNKREAVYVFKRKGVYYWTLAENFNTLTYWTGDTPYGPFTYRGRIMDPYGGNNHHSVIQYQDHWLLFYHRWTKMEDGEFGRRTCIDELRFNPDGSIQKITSSDHGVDFSHRFPVSKPMKEMWYEDEQYVGYLFMHMTSSDYGKMYYALSRDGLHFKRINGGKRVYDDYRGHPCITKGHDGRYYACGGGSPITFWVSPDLVDWEKHSEFLPEVERTPNFTPGRDGGGAPKVFYDRKTECYMITWQTSLYAKRGGFKHPLEDERYWGGQRALFALSKDLKNFSDPRVLLPGFDSGQLDIFVTRLGEKYYTIFKDERYPSYEWPTGKTVRICSSDKLTGPYSLPGPSLSPNFCEAPSLVPKLDGTGYYMYFERYQGQGYEVATGPAMEGPWYDVYKMEYSFPEDCRHGWIHPITQKQWDAITEAFGED